ncbi:MAG: DoxX family protein [Mycobacterium sp.]
MAPLIALVLATLATRFAGRPGWDYASGWPAAVAVGLAAMFVLTGVAHFVQPLRGDMIAIVPPPLPAPGVLVSVTGVLELLGAVGLLLPATRVAAAVCLFALMLAMFPANLYAARNPDAPKSMSKPLGRRTAEEVIFLAGAALVAVGSI